MRPGQPYPATFQSFQWTDRELNPDLQFAELASFHWTISPLYRVDRARVELATPTLQGSVASWEHASPLSPEVRSEIEPDLPPYRGGMLPEHLQTISSTVIPGGVEPPLSWLSPRCLRRWTTGSSLLSSDRGGSRTHRHEALELAAMPICVPGRGGSGSCTQRSGLMKPS